MENQIVDFNNINLDLNITKAKNKVFITFTINNLL